MHLCFFLFVLIKSLLPFFTEALKSYPYQMRTGKLQIPEMEQLANASRGLAPDMNNGFFSTEVDESMGFPWKA